MAQKQPAIVAAPADGEDDIRRMVTEIVAAYVSKNVVAPGELPALMQTIYATLGGFSGKATKKGDAPARNPAVPVRKSVTPDYIVCLEDGKKLKMLKRHLRARYKMSPDEYRTKWGLPSDYPMTAPNYAAKRSAYAKQIGLGKGAASKGRRKKS